MKDVIVLLNENRSGYLGSIENGKPRVRPFEFQYEENGKYYFCTSNKKEVYKQLKENPFIEFSTTSKDYKTVRIRGEVFFKNYITVKENILKNNKLVNSIYKSADNPAFEIFFMEHGDAVISDFSGKPPVKIKF